MVQSGQTIQDYEENAVQRLQNTLFNICDWCVDHLQEAVHKVLDFLHTPFDWPTPEDFKD